MGDGEHERRERGKGEGQAAARLRGGKKAGPTHIPLPVLLQAALGGVRWAAALPPPTRQARVRATNSAGVRRRAGCGWGGGMVVPRAKAEEKKARRAPPFRADRAQQVAARAVKRAPAGRGDVRLHAGVGRGSTAACVKKKGGGREGKRGRAERRSAPETPVLVLALLSALESILCLARVPPPASPLPRARPPTPLRRSRAVPSPSKPTTMVQPPRPAVASSGGRAKTAGLGSLAHPSRSRDWENPSVTARNRCEGIPLACRQGWPGRLASG